MVVADAPGGDLAASLASIERERAAAPSEIEVLPVRAADARPGALVPELWGIGMRRAASDVVAITTSQFTPGAGWIAEMRRAHARLTSAAIGGPILPPERPALVDDATFFVRYGAYLGIGDEQSLPDLAGDNASYKRRVAVEHAGPAGFWEHEVHRALVVRGEALTFVPAIQVTLRSSSGFLSFVRQRLAHGRLHGSERAASMDVLRRLLRAAAFPAIPLLMARRALGRAGARPELRGRFLRCLPIVLCFYTAWALGEAWGYALPARRA